MPTSVIENYLKTLYLLEDKKGHINVTELSRKMGVSKPTVSNMVKKLQRQDWLIYEKYKPLKLTQKGKREALKIVRKHRLTELFLYEIMGFGWEEVHEVAEQIEHIDSEKFFLRMDQMLGYPSMDPHGSPIPDKQGNLVSHNLKKIASLLEGQEGVLRAISESSPELLEYLNQRNISLGSTVSLLKIEPFDKSCHISCDKKKSIVISMKIAENLLVEPI